MPLDLSKLTSPRAQLAINGALFVALGAVIVDRIASDDPQRSEKLADLGSALASGSATPQKQRADNLDTSELHRVVKTLREACPGSYDLGGGLVQPGAEYTTGGNFDPGFRLVEWLACCTKYGGTYNAERSTCIYGPGAASWVVLGSSCEDREESTWCEVRLRNDAKAALRPVVFVRRGP